MSNKNTASLSINGPANKTPKPSVFNRIVKEVDITEIPVKYVEQVIIQHHGGNITELTSSEITRSIIVDENIPFNSLARSLKDIKIFINVDLLEIDINKKVEQFLGVYC